MVSNKDVADEEVMWNYDQTNTFRCDVDLCGLFRSQEDFCEEWWIANYIRTHNRSWRKNLV